MESAIERVFLFCFSYEPWVNCTATNTSEWQALAEELVIASLFLPLG